RSLIHSRVRLAPRLSPVLAHTNPSGVPCRICVPPHFRTRQVVHFTVHAPHAAPDLRIERQPVGGIRPLTRHAGGGTLPAGTPVFAAKESDICVSDELTGRIEGIKVDSVGIGHIEPSARPLSRGHFARVYRPPGGASVTGLHGPPKISAVGEVRILIGHSKCERIFSPPNTKARSNPGIVHIRSGGIGFLPNQLPGLSGILGLCHSHPFLLLPFESQSAVGQVGHSAIASAGCDCTNLNPGAREP